MLMAFISETIFLVLVLHIAWMRKCLFVKPGPADQAASTTEDLMRLMTYDSIKYFIA